MPDAELITNLLISFPIILFALSVHEAAHAITAKWGGDMTAASQGRVTLNPVSHIDPIGTILVPLLSVLSSIPLIGWAKPVPTVDSNYTKGHNYGIVVAMAGPFSNLLLALFSMVLLMFVIGSGGIFAAAGIEPNGRVFDLVTQILVTSVMANIFLMLFNLMPIPPLDGSWLVWYWFVRGNPSREELFFTVARWGWLILLLLLWTNIADLYLRTVGFGVVNTLLGYVNAYAERM